MMIHITCKKYVSGNLLFVLQIQIHTHKPFKCIFLQQESIDSAYLRIDANKFFLSPGRCSSGNKPVQLLIVATSFLLLIAPSFFVDCCPIFFSLIAPSGHFSSFHHCLNFPPTPVLYYHMTICYGPNNQWYRYKLWTIDMFDENSTFSFDMNFWQVCDASGFEI